MVEWAWQEEDDELTASDSWDGCPICDGDHDSEDCRKADCGE